MSNLTNSVNVNGYNYTIGPGNTGSSSTTPASLSITILPATIDFAKTNNPEYIDLGQSSTVKYSITNLNAEPVTLATITDPLLTLPGVTVTNLQNATQVGNVLTVTLPQGSLGQNKNVTVSATINVAQNAVPSSTTYDTTAAGAFTVATVPSTIINKNVRGLLQVNSAVLTLTKTLVPNLPTITAGNLLTYTITLTNTGNVDANIPSGAFVDNWTANSLLNITVSDSRFTFTNSRLTNNIAIPIAAGASLVITLAGTANNV